MSNTNDPPPVERLEAVLKKRPLQLVIDDGTGVETIKDIEIVELTGEQRDRYLTVMRKKTKGATDVSAVRDFTGIQSTLLKMCVRCKETKELLSEEELKNYPTSTQSRMFEIAQELSGFTQPKDKEDDEEEGEE